MSEQDVMDVEKTYWALKGSGKFDLETFQQHISPPLPEELLPGVCGVCVLFVLRKIKRTEK